MPCKKDDVEFRPDITLLINGMPLVFIEVKKSNNQQISQITDRAEMLKVTRALNTARELYNLIRLSGNYELLDKLDFQKLAVLTQKDPVFISLNEELERPFKKKNLSQIFQKSRFDNWILGATK